MAKASTELFTASELKKVRAELEQEATELRADLADSQSDIAGIVSDSGSAAGDDIADVGSKTFEREQEMLVADQVNESLEQVERAIARIDAGTYGICENCGEPIGKLRLEAYPRATLCLTCKIAAGG